MAIQLRPYRLISYITPNKNEIINLLEKLNQYNIVYKYQYNGTSSMKSISWKYTHFGINITAKFPAFHGVFAYTLRKEISRQKQILKPNTYEHSYYYHD